MVDSYMTYLQLLITLSEREKKIKYIIYKPCAVY